MKRLRTATTTGTVSIGAPQEDLQDVPARLSLAFTRPFAASRIFPFSAMRVFYVALLAAVVQLAVTSAASTTTAARFIPPAYQTYHQYVSTTRMLRNGRTQGEEERGAKLSSKLIKWLTPDELKLPKAEKLRVRDWVRNEQASDHVFQQLELGAGMTKALNNPKLASYAAFTDKFNKKYPDKKVTMIDMFTKTYGDDVVAKVLERQMQATWKTDPRTDAMTSRLRKELLNKWELNGEDADDIFKLLKLDKAGSGLLVAPQLGMWYSYTRMTYTRDPDTVMVSILASRYGYDGLSKIFLTTAPKTEFMRHIAVKLETAMSNLSPGDVFKMLKLDEGLENLLTNPSMRMWNSHLTAFNLKNPELATTRMEILTKFYRYKALSDMLEAAKQSPRTQKIASEMLLELKKHKLRGRQIQKP